jgi:predicted MPP superfamily phosphohydrolase
MKPTFWLEHYQQEKSMESTIIGKKLRKNSIVLLPLYDIHFGSKECDEELFLKALRYIKNRKECLTFLGGDIIECATYGKMNNVHDQKHQINEQIEKVVALLKPIRNQIMFMICGNHEHRIEKATGLNIVKIISEMLGIPYLGWEAHFFFKFKNKQFCRGYAHHGNGCAATSGSKLNALEKLHFSSPMANLICAGHTHSPINSEKEIRYLSADGILKSFIQFFVSCGTTHKSAGYATMRGYGPVSTTLSKITIKATTSIQIQVEKFR